MLFAAKLKDVHPKKLVLLGIQPADLDIGMDLSSTIAPEVDTLISLTVDQLNVWGHPIKEIDRQIVAA